MSTYLIKNASPYGEDTTDILIDGGIIAAMGADAAAKAAELDNLQTIDATGLIALPGLVDPHTHLREPGREDAETVLSGSQAAALGGYTCVHAMANTTPVADTAGVVEQVQHLGEEAGLVEVRPVGAVTIGLKGEQLAALGLMADSAAKVRMFSDDGICVADPLLMRRALEYVKAFDGVIAEHAQDAKLTRGAQMHEGVISAKLGLAGWPAVAEEAIVARDILLAEHVDSRIHILHLSTAGSVDLVRQGKKRGVKVTAEATPHHLLLNDSYAETYDPIFKVNPPLRTDEDRAALAAAIVDGTIDVIGTDHAPHPAEDKECEWEAGANGMLGLQNALSVVQKVLVDTGMITWRDVARIMSEKPAELGQVEGQGRPIAVGEPANLTLVDPEARQTFARDDIVSLSSNSPYVGMELPGRVMATFFRGRQTVSDAKLVP